MVGAADSNWTPNQPGLVSYYGWEAEMSEQPEAVRFQIRESPWVRLPATESRGEHATESTTHVSAPPVYQIPRIEVSGSAKR